MKILIVEDNMADRMLLRYNCERHGYPDVIEACDGQEGLELARLHKPDLIISDALMPRMDGFHFLRALQAQEDLKTIPFVFYSATYTGWNEEELARSLGARTFISKPLEPEAFWTALTGVLRDAETGTRRPPSPAPAEGEEDYLKEYSRIVATKLEEKVRELHEARDRIALSEAFIKNILESVGEGFIVVNRDYVIVSANNAYAKMVNMPVAEILGKSCHECSHRRDNPCYEYGADCAVRHTFETGEPWMTVHTHYAREGGPATVETKAFPMRDESGLVTLVIAICIDVTVRKKLDDQLRQEQKLEALGVLAVGIARSFNNALTAIIGQGRLLNQTLKRDDPLRANVDQLLEAARGAARLTRSLMTFGGKQAVTLEPIDLNDVILRLRTSLRHAVGEDIELKTEVGRDPLTIDGDKGGLEQVLVNLATNARAAMPRGGVFTVRSEIAEVGDEYARTHGIGSRGTYARLTAFDTGLGMNEETRARVFEPFFTTTEGGAGLGLPLVYSIVKQHRGFVEVSSEPGRGTTFTIHLPLGSPAETPGPDGPHEEDPPRPGSVPPDAA